MTNNPAMQECKQLCRECADVCQEALFQHCLPKGGKYAEPQHVTLMADCIEACQTAASFMARHSRLHAAICHACAEVCEACAESCERLDDAAMKKCAEMCRCCATSCREMSQMRKAA